MAVNVLIKMVRKIKASDLVKLEEVKYEKDSSSLIKKMQLMEQGKIKTSKASYLNFKEIEKDLLNCKSYIKVINNGEEKSLSIILDEIRLVSLNEMFVTFQNRKYEMFKYKKLWHKTITNILKNYRGELPIFAKEKIKITYFREAARYFDHDSLIPSFKFFLDAVVENKIINDDNPNIVDDMKPIQQIKKGKRKSLLGMRIEKIKNQNINDKEINIFEEWGILERQEDKGLDERF